MTDRRTFLKQSTLLLSGLAAPVWAQKPAVPQDSQSLLIHDARLGPGDLPGQIAATNGTHICPIDRDVSDVWFDHVAPNAPHAPQSGFVFGMTQQTDLFILRQFGRGTAQEIVELGSCARHGIDRSFCRMLDIANYAGSRRVSLDAALRETQSTETGRRNSPDGLSFWVLRRAT